MHLIKSLLSIKSQKRNRAALKMNLFTPMAELWNYDSRNLCSKKGSFFEQLFGRPCVMAALGLKAFPVLFLLFFFCFLQYMRETIACKEKKTRRMHCSGLSLAATIKTATQFKIHHNSRNCIFEDKTDNAFKLCEHAP